MSPAPVDPFPDFVNGTTADGDQVDARMLALYRALNKAQIGLDAASIQDLAITTPLIAAGAVTGAKLETGILSAYEGRKVHECPAALSQGAAATTHFPHTQGGFIPITAAVATGLKFFTLSSADIPAVAGKSPKLRLRSTFGVGGNVAPGITFSPSLFQITALTGGALTIGVATVTGIPGSAVAPIVSPGIGVTGAPVSGDFDPVNGLLMVGLGTSGVMPANSIVAFNFELHLHYV
jgi:hypothetical protein